MTPGFVFVLPKNIVRTPGLHQLVFFARRRNREAICILAESANPNRYFPFAAAGVSTFCVGILV